MHQEIEDYLDIPGLLALGGSYEYFRPRVSETLKKERDAIIREYWGVPDVLLRYLTWH